MAVRRLLGSFSFRLALGYGLLVVGSLAVMATVLYVGTVGVLRRQIDADLVATSARLTRLAETRGLAALQEEIQQLLTDNIDQDTEVYFLIGPDGARIGGNITDWKGRSVLRDRPIEQAFTRYGRPSVSRLLVHRLSNGYSVVVGRDLRDIHALESLLQHALMWGGALALLLAIAGAVLFRRQLERRIAAIRHTALEIEAGDMSRRIPVGPAEDEFTRLSRTLNHLLDHIHELMEGVRTVSNAIAHDLRTPLSRVRNLLDEALHPGTPPERLRERAVEAIERVDEVAGTLSKLLRIATAESGTAPTAFQPVSLARLLTDVVELYDAAAEAQGTVLRLQVNEDLATMGDRDLLADAMANLIDNALKYAGPGKQVQVIARAEQDHGVIVVQDEGPGIPAEERDRVLTRFYRLDRSRNQPGNGLGLAIVAAISRLHGATLHLEDAAPGLRVCIVLPLLPAFHLAKV